MLANRVVAAIRDRKYLYYRSKYRCSKAGMWKQANEARAASAATPATNEFGVKLNEQFAYKVWLASSSPT